MKNSFFALLILSLSVSHFACHTTEKAEKPGLYQTYDQKVLELRDAVRRDEMTVSEAEELRQEAFREYLQELQEHRVDMEYRNY